MNIGTLGFRVRQSISFVDALLYAGLVLFYTAGQVFNSMGNHMKAFAVSGLFVTLMTASFLLAQEPPKSIPPQKEHELLKQFVGEWESEMEASPGPGQPPMKCKGSMKSRMLGGYWVVSEVESEMFGMPMKGLQTIGYDPKSKKYVGTWVDSMMNHLWKYSGTVDEAGKTLTLDAEGPSFTGEDKLAKYRDAYEFKAKDHIVMTSSMQGEDGKWVTFMTGSLKRKESREKK
jgi:hypothetical protein